jgi:hypothetical protein
MKLTSTVSLFAFFASGCAIEEPPPTPQPNNAPIADDQIHQIQQDQPLPLVLTGSDPDGDTLTYRIRNAPGFGVLEGEPPNLTYTPFTGLYGIDTFTFEVDDGTDVSEAATVEVDIQGVVNTPPTGDELFLELDEDTSISFTVTGSDPDGDDFEIVVVVSPEDGQLEGKSPDFTFIPKRDFAGQTSLGFRVTDSIDPSPVIGVFFTVLPINDAPKASAPNQVRVEQGQTIDIAINMSDVDDPMEALAIDFIDEPDRGQFSVIQGGLRYQASSNFVGEDRFEFRVTDGKAFSDTHRVKIEIESTPSLTAPTAEIEPAVPTLSDDLVCFVAVPSIDPEGDPIQYEVSWKHNDQPYPDPSDTGLAIVGPSTTTLTGDTVPAADTMAGDVWDCRISASDDGVNWIRSPRVDVTVVP